MHIAVIELLAEGMTLADATGLPRDLLLQFLHLMLPGACCASRSRPHTAAITLSASDCVSSPHSSFQAPTASFAKIQLVLLCLCVFHR